MHVDTTHIFLLIHKASDIEQLRLLNALIRFSSLHFIGDNGIVSNVFFMRVPNTHRWDCTVTKSCRVVEREKYFIDISETGRNIFFPFIARKEEKEIVSSIKTL